MKGDFSRDTFDPERHYTSVLMQQGRVQLDADWNEQRAIDRYQVEIRTRDVVGACGAPYEHAGFKLSVTGDNRLLVGAGRYYVDGILCENENEVLYGDQPHLRAPEDPLDLLARSNADTAVVYLDVWQRHITMLDDPHIREVALNGPDTATRSQTVWQVKVLPVRTGQAQGDGVEVINRPRGRVGCVSELQEWDRLLALGTGTLNVRSRPSETPDDPCLVPATAGYQRLENQLYRVEVHQGGPFFPDEGPGGTFKWSRDNGTVVTAVVGSISGHGIPVADLGPDDVLGFAAGQWVELTDDVTELNGEPGQMLQVDEVDQARRVLTMTTEPREVDLERHPRLRRWDTSGPSGTARIEQPESNGGWIALEGGVEVHFSQGVYRTGDFWLIPARVATGDVEWPPHGDPRAAPVEQRPLGIRHHYCRLALLRRKGDTLRVDDCRTIFPPLAAAAMHVVGTSWDNDDVITPQRFLDGIEIELDAPPEEGTVDENTMIVSVEVPPRQADPSVAPDWTFILDGGISLEEGTTIRWVPVQSSLQVLNSVVEDGSARLRVTLKGHVIWTQQFDRRLYLDGQAFGEQVSRPGRERRTALIYPSGNGARASDFESWFFIMRD